MNKFSAILLVAVLVLAVLLVGKQRQLNQARLELSRLGGAAAAANDQSALQDENQQLKDEVNTLRNNQRELIRLRGEVGVLRRQSQIAASPSLHQGPAVETNEIASLSETNSYPTNTYTVKTKVQIGNGQTLITGGWQITPGKRYYLLVTPQSTGGDGLAKVQVNTLFVEGPDSILSEAGLDFGPAGRDSFASRVIDGGETEALVNKLLSTSGVDVLTSPTMTAINGRKTVLNAAEVNPAPGQESPAFLGPIVQITPTLSADGQSLELDLVGQMTREGL